MTHLGVVPPSLVRCPDRYQLRHHLATNYRLRQRVGILKKIRLLAVTFGRLIGNRLTTSACRTISLDATVYSLQAPRHAAAPTGEAIDMEKAPDVRPRRSAETPASVARSQYSVAPSRRVTRSQVGTCSAQTPALKRIVPRKAKVPNSVPDLVRIRRKKGKTLMLCCNLLSTVPADLLSLSRPRWIIPGAIENFP